LKDSAWISWTPGQGSADGAGAVGWAIEDGLWYVSSNSCEEAMSYEEQLATRVRHALAGQRDVAEKRMFGGVCFMVNGAMCCGVLQADLIVRVGAARYAEAMARPHTRPFDFSGRPAKGMVYVSPEGIRSDASLAVWIQLALAVRREAQPKTASKRAPRAAKR
jgi:TfoX/Sxy family transcriptional regulator of competence genes